MEEMLRLNEVNLGKLSRLVRTPSYNRKFTRTGIVHIGVGGFHRSHQAFYTDEVLSRDDSNKWGICGVSLLDNETDQKNFYSLARQDGLYTLLVAEPDGALNARILGPIIRYLFAPLNPEAVISIMASPEIRIITLTITEGGYNFNSATGEFRFEDPGILWDISHSDHPVTVFGYLTQALKRRKTNKAPGITIQSCDNIEKNGKTIEKMLMSYINAAEPDLISWIEDHVTFPDSMVDRITPATKPSDIEILEQKFGYSDSWPVVSEPFLQWIIEDKFASGRPLWESAGAQFVQDVAPYEKMKIRLLNAGHSLLGFTGSIYGCNTVDEAVSVPFINSFLRNFMDREVTPLLGSLEGINLEIYKDNLIQRFGNRYIGDHLSRICSESSSKIPKFLLPTIREQLEKDGPVEKGILVIAAWCRCLELAGAPQYNIDIQDKLGSILKRNAMESLHDDPLAFIKTEEIFSGLTGSKRFVDTYLRSIDMIRKKGIEEAVKAVNG